MEFLYIAPSKTTPEICFDFKKMEFDISGISRPENITLIGQKVFAWLEKFRNKKRVKKSPLNFFIKLRYFNPATAELLRDILIFLNESKEEHPLHVTWFYDPEDIESKQDGEELSELTGVPFEYMEMKH